MMSSNVVYYMYMHFVIIYVHQTNNKWTPPSDGHVSFCQAHTNIYYLIPILYILFAVPAVNNFSTYSVLLHIHIY